MRNINIYAREEDKLAYTTSCQLSIHWGACHTVFSDNIAADGIIVLMLEEVGAEMFGHNIQR